jgi:thioredoxin reductase
MVLNTHVPHQGTHEMVVIGGGPAGLTAGIYAARGRLDVVLLERLRVRNSKTGKESTLEVNGVFIFVGAQPATGFLNGAVDLDEQGFIKVDRRQQTSVPGVFAAGDVVSGTFRQIAAAVGEGASAARHAEEYLDFEKNRTGSNPETFQGIPGFLRLPWT